MTRPEVTSTAAPSAPWRAWLKPVVGLGAVAALWTGGVGVWLPNWARPQIEQAATEALGTPVQVADLRIRPWTLAVELDGVRVGPEAAPWLRVKQAQAQLSLSSIWRLAPVIRRVALLEPQFWLERQGPDQFNISEVMVRLMAPSPEPKADTEPAKFAVFNIELHDGLIRYTDRVLNQEHRIEKLHIGVPFVSNLPSHIDVNVQPSLHALIDGSPLKVDGKTLPFKDGHRSEVQLNWQAVDVAHWLTAAQPFLPPELAITPKQGRLDAALTVQFEQRPAPAAPMLRIAGGLQLKQLALGMPHAPGLGQVDTGWETLKMEGLDALPLERRVSVTSVALDGLHLKARPTRADGPAMPKPVSSRSAAATPESERPASAAEQPWQWAVKSLHVAAQAIDVQTSTEAPWPRLDRAVLNVQGLDAAPKAPAATWRLDVADQHGTTLRVQGKADVARQQVEASVNLAQAPVQPWLAPLHKSLALPLLVKEGALSLQAQVHARLLADASAASPELASPGVTLRAGSVKLAGVRTQAAAAGVPDQVNLGELSVDGVEAHLALDGPQAGLQRLAMDSVTLNGLDARVTRGAQGQWLGMAPVPPHHAPSKASSPAGRSKAEPALPPVTIAAMRCTACRIQVNDQTVKPAAVLSLQQTDLNLTNVSSDLGKPFKVALRTQAQGRGQLNFEGDVRAQPLFVQGQVGVARVDLRVLQSYLNPHVNFQIAGAHAQASGRVQVNEHATQGLSVRYQGRVGVSDLRLKDRVNDADFVSWRSLSLDGTDLAWANGQVNANLGRIGLREFFGRIIIRPDGTLNLASLASKEAGESPESLTTPQASAAASAVAEAASEAAPVASSVAVVAASASVPASASDGPTAPDAPPMKLRWQEIKLSKGRVHFTDNFIKPNYSANLTRIDGTISAVSSDKPDAAKVDVSGAVDDGAPLKITGEVHPLGAKLFTDIQGSAKGIELTRLTPYAARYAGYAIEKGSLSMTVRYKIDGGKLEAENQVFLDQLTFGEKTDSPDATSLPVLFAVSLLKNRHGEIDVTLPISGSLDDPQFSVGGIIWQVIGNLISKAVTAPFSLLSGGSNELGFVPFAPGSATLTDAAHERLDTLADKLDDRPSLKLEATGRADAEVDVAGLRAAHVERLMRRAKAQATGLEPAAVTIEPSERNQWLTAAYKAADIKKPRNLVGLAKTLPPEEMVALLGASAAAGEAELKRLADMRGNVVKAYLATKISPERVLLTASKLGKGGLPDDKGPGSRVQFDLK